MGNIVYSIMVSLDGYINGPDKNLDWPIIDAELHKFVNERVRAGSAFLYGRRMYMMMEADWPTMDADPSNPDYIIEYSKIYKSKPRIVFSKTMEAVEGGPRIIRGGIAEEAARLKAEYPGDLMLGGAELAAAFIRLDLVDEYQLYIHPVILGGGASMFPALDHLIELRLLETRTFASGVSFLRYTSRETV